MFSLPYRNKVVITFFVAFMFFLAVCIIRERGEYVQQLYVKLDACRREVESVSTQLILFTQHKKKLETSMGNIERKHASDVEDYKTQIKRLQAERADWQQKLDECQSKAVLKVPMTSNVEILKDENAKKDAEIEKLRDEVANLQRIQNESLIHVMSTAGATAINTANATENRPLDVPFDPLHPQEERKGYADGPNVQFHRVKPGQNDLEFRRDNNDPGDQPIPRVLLSPEEIMNKVQGRHQKPVNDENDKVVDYQSLKKPNRNEDDYKEME